MQQHLIRSSLIVALTVLAICLLAPSTASAGSCTSEGNEAWTGGFTCDGVPDQTPASGDYVTISTDHTITLNINPTYNSLSVDGTLVIGNAGVILTNPTAISGILDLGPNDLTVNNTYFSGDTVLGSGTFRTQGVVSLSSHGTFNPSLNVVSGTTVFDGVFHGAITIQAGATLEVPAGSPVNVYGDVTVYGTLAGGDSNSYLLFYGTTFTNNGSSVSLDNLHFYGAGTQTIVGTGPWTGTGSFSIEADSNTSLVNNVSMSFSSYSVAGGVFSLEDHTLAFNAPMTLNFINYGVFDIGSQSLAFNAPGGATFTNNGTTAGSGTFQTSGTVSLFAYGSFSPPLEVLSGTTIASGYIHDAITIRANATLEVLASGSLYVYDDVTVHGTLTDGDPSSILYFYGPGSQTIAGGGSWTGTGTLDVNSETALANDVTMAFSKYRVWDVVSLGDHTLTFNSSTTLNFENYGTFDIGSHTLAFRAPDGASFTDQGNTTGTGAFQTSGTASLFAHGFSLPLEVASGTTITSGSVQGPITVQADAMLKARGLFAYGDVTVHGTLSVDDPNLRLDFFGPTFTNTGSVLNLGTVSFRGSGPQTIVGAGSWTGTGRFDIEQSSETSLTNDVTIALSQLIVNYGILSLNNHTLTFGAPGGATFTNYGTTAGSGTFQTSGTVSLFVGYSSAFAPSLNVASGTTTMSGRIGGAISVQPGATLQVEAGGSLFAYGDVTIHGTLSGGDSNSSLYFYGATFTNTGSSVSLDNVYFYGTGPQTISGAGLWTGTGTLSIGGSETVLANDVTMAFSLFSVSGSLSLGDHNLTIGSPGGTTFSNYGIVFGTGVFRTTGAVSFYNGGTFSPSFDVVSGTTTAGGSIQGAISVQAGATLLVQASSGLSTYGDVAVHGTLSDGDSNSFLRFSGTGPQTISGAGSWTGTGMLSIDYGSETTLTNDVTMSFAEFFVGGTFALADHALTFNSPSTLTFNNNGTFDVGSQALAFHAPNGATFNNYGATIGTGTFQTSGAVMLDSGGSFNAPINVFSGTTTANGSIHGAITVQIGATLLVQYGLLAYGDVTVHGTLSGGDSNSYLYFYGATFTNTGSSVSLDNVSFYGTGPQTIVGAGLWTGTGWLQIDSATTLANDVTMAFSQYGMSGVLSLDNHTLTFDSATSLTLTIYGIFDIGSQTLAFHAPDGATFYNYGTTTGNGSFQTSGTVNLYTGSSRTFNPRLEVASGSTAAYGHVQGDITVQVGATLVVPASNSLFAYGDVVVHGTLSDGDSNSSFWFYGTGPQTISGAGSWTGTGKLYIASGSETTLANDMTMAFSQYQVGGVFSLGDHVLTFNAPSTLAFTNGGVFDLGSQTLAFHAPASATYYSNYGATTGTGTFQTSGTVSLTSYDTFSSPLEVASGTTTAAGEINGALTVEAGAVLTVRAGNSVIASSDATVATVNGTLSGGNLNSYIYLLGSTFTNNGFITVANVYFGNGPHVVQGVGSFSGNTARIVSGATVDLATSHQMSNVVIYGGGVFNLDGFTLSLAGSGNPLINDGAFDTADSTVVYNGTAPQIVATANTDYHSLGIDNATGVALSDAETVPGSLILINGHLILGTHTLTLGDAATIGGTSSAAAMVVADGDGFLRKTSAGPLSFTFPIGDSSGAYAPVSLECTTFPAGGAVDARLRDAVHPAMNGDTYLTRYWTLTSDATDAGCIGVFSYAQDDVVGVESNLMPAKYDGFAWSVLGSGAVNPTTNTLTGSFDSFSDFTGGEGSALAIYLSSFSAEPMREGILVSWETISEINNQGFNLYRNTDPIRADEPVAFIPSQAPGSSQGSAYEWIDNDVVSGHTYYYWLEDIDLNGTTTLHGPVSATVNAPTAVTISRLYSSSQPADGWLATLITAVKAFVTTTLSR